MRQAEFTRNLARFCDRHRTVDTYLYWRKWKSRISLETASDLLDEVGGARWRAELIDTYGALLDAERSHVREWEVGTSCDSTP